LKENIKLQNAQIALAEARVQVDILSQQVTYMEQLQKNMAEQDLLMMNLQERLNAQKEVA
jgi:hypothetical protein